MKIISHIPTINATGIFRNEAIIVYFDRPIDAKSITWDTLSVNDTSTFTSVVGSIGPLWVSGVNLSGVTSGVTFIPTTNLLPNTEYSVYVYGAPNSIIAKDKTQLQDTYSYSFVTGTGYYSSVGVVGVPSGVEAETLIDLSGIIASEESAITVFTVYSTNPKNQAPNLNLSLSEIQVIFTGNISTNINTLSGMITLERNDVI